MGESDSVFVVDAFPKNGSEIRNVAIGSRLEVGLFEGIFFTTAASKFPCAYDICKKSENLGQRCLGYVVGRDESFTFFSSESFSADRKTHSILENFGVENSALYGFRELVQYKRNPEQEIRA